MSDKNLHKDITTERLRNVIDKSRQTREKIAEGVNMDTSTVTKYYNGDRKLTAEAIKKFAVYFNISADYLLGLSDAQTNDKDLQFVCDYTGLSADVIKNLKDSVIYGDLRSNDLICIEAIRDSSDVYFECKNDLLQSTAIKQIISCIVYEKLLYKNLSELKRRVDSNEMKDDFDTHHLTMKVLKWENQHKINLFNAQDSLMNFVKGYTPLEKIDKNLYDSLVNIATTYTPFENEQKERDEFENRCKSYDLYFALEGDSLNGNDN